MLYICNMYNAPQHECYYIEKSLAWALDQIIPTGEGLTLKEKR